MSQDIPCPDLHTLRQHALGALPEAEAAAVRRHVRNCGGCAERLQPMLGGETLFHAPAREPAASAAPAGKSSAPPTEEATLCEEAPAAERHAAAAALPPEEAASDATMVEPARSKDTDDLTVLLNQGKTSGTRPAQDRPPPDPDQTLLLTIPPAAPAGEPWRGLLAPPQAADEVGRLGPYRVLRLLGSGTTGAVFEAEDPQLRRRVALRAVPPALAPAGECRERLLRQARLAASLEHDHAVQIHDVGEDRGVVFLAMQMLQGEPLSRRLDREGKLPPAEAARVGREAAEALAEAHARGLAHGDLTAATVWLEARAGERSAGRIRVKVLDFGLARALGPTTSLQPRPAEDLLALGRILYRACTGERPDPARQRPPREVNPEVPAALSELILRLLTPGSGRPGSAREAAAALAAVEGELAGAVTLDWSARQARTAAFKARAGTPPPPPRGSGPVPVIKKQKARPRWQLAVLATLLLAGLASGGALALHLFGGGDDTGPPDGGPRRVAADSLRRGDIPARLLAAADGVRAPDQLVAVLGDTRQRTGSVLLGGTGGMLKAPLKALAFSPDGKYLAAGEVATPARPSEVRLLDPGTGKTLRAFDGPKGGVVALAFSPDGKYLAAAGGEPGARVWDVQSGEPVGDLPWHDGPVTCLAFSPDGARVVTGGRDRTVRVWEAGSARELVSFGTASAHDQPVTGVAFSGDGKRVLSASLDGTLRFWDADKAELKQTVNAGSPVTALARAPDGSWFAGACRDGTVRVWDADGKQTASLRAGAGFGAVLAVGRDGKSLATAGGADPAVKVWEAGAWKEVFTLKGHTAVVGGLAFAPDGKTLASASSDRTVRTWDVTADPRRPREESHEGPVLAVAVRPDGALAASAGADGTVRLWGLATGRVQKTLSGHGGQVYHLAFSPDGTRLAAACNDGSVRLWDPDSGTQVRTHRAHTGKVNAVAFSPDGRLIASAGQDRVIRVEEAATGKEQPALRGHTGGVTALAFAGNGELVSAGADATLRVWEVASGRALPSPAGPPRVVISLAAAADGKRLASGGEDMAVRLWAAAPWREERALFGHAGAVIAVAFRPDGGEVASAGTDGSVRLWGLASDPAAQTVIPLFPAGTRPAGLAYTPEGRHLLVAGPNGTVLVLRLASPPAND